MNVARRQPNVGDLEAIRGGKYDKQYVHRLQPDLAGFVDAAAVLRSDMTPAEASRAGVTSPWSLVCLDLIACGRSHHSLAAAQAWYDLQLMYQESTGERCHKGMPLIRIAEALTAMRCYAMAKRAAMLTLVEDAITNGGYKRRAFVGVNILLHHSYGMPEAQIKRYADAAASVARSLAVLQRYPEAVLQHLDLEWQSEPPDQTEVMYYSVNTHYVKHLLAEAGGDKSGKTLERLAHYVTGCMPGCRTYWDVQPLTHQLDVVGVFDGPVYDFRSELGRYFACECKDWAKRAGYGVLAEFAQKLQQAKVRFGILLSSEGLTGESEGDYGYRAQQMIYQSQGVAVLVLTRDDLQRLSDGANLVTILRERYEQVRWDLQPGQVLASCAPSAAKPSRTSRKAARSASSGKPARKPRAGRKASRKQSARRKRDTP